MFGIGQKVICNNKGVCIIEDIATLDISGVDKNKKYYILKPVFISASTVYVPVDSAMTSMRKILTKEEAKELIRDIPQIPVLEIKNERLLEQDYKLCLKTNECNQWIKLLKTIYERKQMRLQKGRKETAIDSKYFRIAEEVLYGELAVALDMDRDRVSQYIEEQLNK